MPLTPICEYPLCGELAVHRVAVVMQPEQVLVALCKAHLTMVERRVGDPDFGRWWDAMSGMDG